MAWGGLAGRYDISWEAGVEREERGDGRCLYPVMECVQGEDI